jgi:cytochrome d ubiquinol oxidase subunit II
MHVTWFWLLWTMFAIYVVLDGLDLGAGILHLFVARDPGARAQVIRSVGPVWDGNEVWLLAAGGTLVLAFPAAYAAAFSGFYLPFMIVLWLLLGRALGIELRHQLDDPMWVQFWDVVFAVSSTLLAIFFGAALGNVVRGVTFDGDGTFFAPLWTSFSVDGPTGILDWYTVLVGLTAVAALAHHGGLWLAARTAGAVQAAGERAAARLWPAAAVLAAAVTAASFAVQPNLGARLSAHWWGAIFALMAAGGLAGSALLRRRGRRRGAFRASGLFLFGMVLCAAFGVFPWLLPGRGAAEGLTALAAAAGREGLVTALVWWIPGMIAVSAYTWRVNYRDPRP